MILGTRKPDRLVEGIVLALVVGAIGFAATAPRASFTPSAPVKVVAAPAPACAGVAISGRSACLELARAIAMRD